MQPSALRSFVRIAAVATLAMGLAFAVAEFLSRQLI
jgi:hypothetical protein